MNQLTNKTSNNCNVIFDIAEKAYIALVNDEQQAEVDALCDLVLKAMDAGGKGAALEVLRDYLGSLGYELPW